MDRDRPIVIAGAGSIGCFVGGLLALGGRDVRFLGRVGLAHSLDRAGLHLTCYTGLDRRLPAARLHFDTDPSVLRDAGLAIVTVKSAQTEEMAALIHRHAPLDAVVLSLQNGVDNPTILRRALPGWRVAGGMVPFNVVRIGDARFHRGSSGPLVIEAGIPGLRESISVPGLACRMARDFPSVQWGKLLLNLNNALNALSGLTLRDELTRRAWRSLLADQVEEALRALAAACIGASTGSLLPARLLPAILRAPDWLFPILARSAVRIDAEARSSMWEDLQRGRPTAIDALQGRVIALAESRGIAVPVNRRVVAMIRRREAGDDVPITPEQIREF